MQVNAEVEASVLCACLALPNVDTTSDMYAYCKQVLWSKRDSGEDLATTTTLERKQLILSFW